MSEKKEIVMSEQQINAAIKRVKTAVEKVEKGYISIVNDVGMLKECNAHKNYGCRNFYDFCKEQFGMSKSTASRLLLIYSNFAVDGKVPKEVSDRGLRPLLAELDKPVNGSEDKETEPVKGSEDKETEPVSEGEEIPFSPENNVYTQVFSTFEEYEAWANGEGYSDFTAGIMGKVTRISITITTD